MSVSRLKVRGKQIKLKVRGKQLKLKVRGKQKKPFAPLLITHLTANSAFPVQASRLHLGHWMTNAAREKSASSSFSFAFPLFLLFPLDALAFVCRFPFCKQQEHRTIHYRNPRASVVYSPITIAPAYSLKETSNCKTPATWDITTVDKTTRSNKLGKLQKLCSISPNILIF